MSQLYPLVELIQEGLELEATPTPGSEDEIIGLGLQCCGGYLACNVILVTDGVGGCQSIVMQVWFLCREGEPFDFGPNSLERLTAIQEIQSQLEWGILNATENDGVREPYLYRCDVLDYDVDFADQNLEQIVIILSLLLNEAQECLPDIAAVCAGEKKLEMPDLLAEASTSQAVN